MHHKISLIRKRTLFGEKNKKTIKPALRTSDEEENLLLSGCGSCWARLPLASLERSEGWVGTVVTSPWRRPWHKAWPEGCPWCMTSDPAPCPPLPSACFAPIGWRRGGTAWTTRHWPPVNRKIRCKVKGQVVWKLQMSIRNKQVYNSKETKRERRSTRWEGGRERERVRMFKGERGQMVIYTQLKEEEWRKKAPQHNTATKRKKYTTIRKPSTKHLIFS